MILEKDKLFAVCCEEFLTEKELPKNVDMYDFVDNKGVRHKIFSTNDIISNTEKRKTIKEQLQSICNTIFSKDVEERLYLYKSKGFIDENCPVSYLTLASTLQVLGETNPMNTIMDWLYNKYHD